MAALLPVPRIQWTDGNGSPLVGGSVTFAQPSTAGNQLRLVWGDEAETTPLQNPVPLDSAGIAFSGGSQASIWGYGQYEAWVRDADGNLIYSALLDTGGSLEGGTINGSVQINGNLSVSGSITDQLSITAPVMNAVNASFSGTVGAGAFSGGSANISGNVTAGGLVGTNGLITGTQTVNGNENVGGTMTAGAVATGAIDGTSLGINGGATITGALNVGQLLIGGQPFTIPRVEGGVVECNTSFGNNFSVGISFNNVLSVSLTCSDAGAGLTVVGIGTGGVTNSSISIEVDGDGSSTYNVYWLAVGN